MSEQKLTGLFINCVEAKDSIFESGMMAYQCLKDSDKYTLDYFEITPENYAISTNYDFYFFNYHFATMSFLTTESIKERLPSVKITMVLEVSPNDPFVYCSPDDFDFYCVLDPTLKIDKENVYAFPRPLEIVDAKDFNQPNEVPVIGSFGFATPGKGFEHVIDAVNKEFDQAVVRINIPYSDYADESGKYAKYLTEMCKKRAKNGIKVVVTHDYMTKQELIKWCGQNTLNCFLYDRNQPGLAATTDQSITSGRPLITSKNNTFRHIQKYIKPFPYQSLKDAIGNTPKIIKEIQNDWSPENFRKRFEEVLSKIQFDKFPQKHPGSVELEIVPPRKRTFFDKIREKVAIRTRLRRLRQRLNTPKVKPKPEVSYSQFGEDTIVNNLLLKDLAFKTMSYLDIGANNPQFISNTFLFYEKGFSGVLVEPNSSLCEKLKAERPRDTVLNVGVGIDENVKEADFYQFGEENDGLSTFSAEEAKYWEEIGMDGIKRLVKQVVKTPLMSVNEIISNYLTEVPDFISIDVEGWDLEILKTFDFEKNSPAVFCVETISYNDDGSTYRNQSIYDFMDSKGYFPFQETTANTVFVNKNLYDFYLYQNGAWTLLSADLG
jgi:FkbM family methyltransferase